MRHRRRYFGGGHHIFRERLTSLELGGFTTWAEAGDSDRAHGIGGTVHERNFRADHHQVSGRAVEGGSGQRGNGGGVAGVDVHGRRIESDTGIARSAGNGGDSWVGEQSTHDGMLAGATSNDQNLHTHDPT